MKNLKKLLIKRKIMGMTDLPMLSGNVVQLMRMLKDPGVPVSKVIDAINKDQSLVAQILKLVNSKTNRGEIAAKWIR